MDSGELTLGLPPIAGTCPDMCPAGERLQRERLRDLSVFERVDGDARRTSPALAVKKFCRTISSADVRSSDIRPLPVLRKTMDYLLQILDSSQHPFEVVHDFLFDRTRSIRQDLSMQNIVNLESTQIYEDVVKFHIISQRRLGQCLDSTEISSLCHLNMEQLMKCLLSLFDLYQTIYRSGLHSKNEAEYHSFYALLHLSKNAQKMGDSLSLWYRQVPSSIFQSKEMRFARTLSRCYHLGNFKQFFCQIAGEATDLQFCLLEPSLYEIRSRALMYMNNSAYKLQNYPLADLAGILVIQESELELLCNLCSLEITIDESGSKLLPPKQKSFSFPRSALPT